VPAIADTLQRSARTRQQQAAVRLCFNPGVIDQRIVVRSTVLLAGALACLSGMVQLVVALGTVTVVLATGVEGVLGLGPAVFLIAGALVALPAGRAMDSHGRVPVLAAGCCAGIAGCLLCAAGAAARSSVLVLAGFVLVGVASGTVLLARAAAADLYPPARRAQGISRVLFGALFGAALGPLVFRPLLAGRELNLASLVVPYLAAAAMMLVGLALVLAVRPEPKLLAERFREPGDERLPAAPLREILSRPGAGVAVLASVASFAVMVSVMNLSGYVIVGHGHPGEDVFTVISWHIVGMYSLVLVIGNLIDRVGRRPSLVWGLAIMAVSTLGLGWAESIAASSLCLFGIGLGWNVSYVAAAAELTQIASPAERGRLIGFTDLVCGFAGASLALMGGVVYTALGVVVLAAAASALAALPAAWIVIRRVPLVAAAG
jgi:MFS family permease